MRVVAQQLSDILDSLQPLKVDWQDEVARRVIARVEAIPVKRRYAAADVQALLDGKFDDGLLICRLFLALSKDEFNAELRNAFGGSSAGVTCYRTDPNRYVRMLARLGLLRAMAHGSVLGSPRPHCIGSR